MPPPSDTIENINKFEPAVADLPCDEILGLVIYDLPGRDCAAKASNGELKVGEIGRYKTEYIDGTSDPGVAHSVLYSISSGIRQTDKAIF